VLRAVSAGRSGLGAGVLSAIGLLGGGRLVTPLTHAKADLVSGRQRRPTGVTQPSAYQSAALALAVGLSWCFVHRSIRADPQTRGRAGAFVRSSLRKVGQRNPASFCATAEIGRTDPLVGDRCLLGSSGSRPWCRCRRGRSYSTRRDRRRSLADRRAMSDADCAGHVGVESATAGSATALADSYEFGGRGSCLTWAAERPLLARILTRYPATECGLFELPHVVAIAPGNLKAEPAAINGAVTAATASSKRCFRPHEIHPERTLSMDGGRPAGRARCRHRRRCGR